MYKFLLSSLRATFLFLPFLLTAAPAPTDNVGIQFDHLSWAETLAKAKQTNRLIFVDAYASWCGPCKYMSANVFTDQQVAAYYNEHFVNLKMDMESTAGEAFGKQYPVRAYPTFLFIDGDGKVVHRVTGGLKAADFIQLGKDAYQPDKQSSNLEQRLRSKLNTATGVSAYLDYLTENDMSTDSVAEAYFAGLKPADWMLVSNWLLLEKYIQNPESPVIQYVEANRAAFSEGVNKELVEKKLRKLYIERLEVLLKADSIDATAYHTSRDRLLHVVDQDELPKIRYYLEYAYFTAKKDTAAAINETIRYVEKSEPTAALFTEYARSLHDDYASSPQAQAKALEWAQKAVDLTETYETLSLYARLLYQTNQNKEALAYAKKARQIARQDGESDNEMKDLVAKLEPKKFPARKIATKSKAKRV